MCIPHTKKKVHVSIEHDVDTVKDEPAIGGANAACVLGEWEEVEAAIGDGETGAVQEEDPQ